MSQRRPSQEKAYLPSMSIVWVTQVSSVPFSCSRLVENSIVCEVISCVCVSVSVYMHMQIRSQPAGAGSLFLLCGSLGSTSGLRDGSMCSYPISISGLEKEAFSPQALGSKDGIGRVTGGYAHCLWVQSFRLWGVAA